MIKKSNLLDKALTFINKWSDAISITNNNLKFKFNEKDIQSLHKQISYIFSDDVDEVLRKKYIVDLGNLYISLDQDKKLIFLSLLNSNFGIDVDSLKKITDKIDGTICPHNIQHSLVKILDYPRKNILKGFVALENGMYFIIKMREEVIKHIKNGHELKNIENDLKFILREWLYIDLLELTTINWKSPAFLLEKLINYEAVHKINSWNDLKNRLDYDRRCYAFLHYYMPYEPLIFVEVALSNHVNTNICSLLDEYDERQDNSHFSHAIFYSISNAQIGLSGISMGNFLIKKVVDDISKKLPNIKHFYTLSPIPKFYDWLVNQLIIDKWIFVFDQDKLRKMIICDVKDEKYVNNLDSVKNEILSLCSYFLLKSDKKHRDPVANFHFSNGASLYNINWKADVSEKGINESLGIMVNYHYDIRKINLRYQDYFNSSKIYSSSGVNNLISCIKRNLKDLN